MVMLRSALRLQESCGEGAVQGQNSEAAQPYPLRFHMLGKHE